MPPVPPANPTQWQNWVNAMLKQQTVDVARLWRGMPPMPGGREFAGGSLSGARVGNQTKISVYHAGRCREVRQSLPDNFLTVIEEAWQNPEGGAIRDGNPASVYLAQGVPGHGQRAHKSSWQLQWDQFSLTDLEPYNQEPPPGAQWIRVVAFFQSRQSQTGTATTDSEFWDIHAELDGTRLPRHEQVAGGEVSVGGSEFVDPDYDNPDPDLVFVNMPNWNLYSSGSGHWYVPSEFAQLSINAWVVQKEIPNQLGMHVESLIDVDHCFILAEYLEPI